MIKYIIGSTALKFFDVPLWREYKDKDLDFWVNEGSGYQQIVGDDVLEVPKHILDMLEYVVDESGNRYVVPDHIMTIKLSHLHHANHAWVKHKRDYLSLKCLGFSVDIDLLFQLRKFWDVKFGNKSFLSLSKNKEDFFTDGVDYKYDHDYLHELVAFPNKPAYTMCLKDGEDVLIDKQKFKMLDEHLQLRMFKEEITVIAIERWLVHNGNMSWIKAYLLSLEKTITRLTKGWACEFILDNLEYYNIPEFSYFENAMTELKIGGCMSKEVFSKVVSGYDISDLGELAGELSIGWNDSWNPSNHKEVVKKIKEELGYKLIEQDGGGESGAEDCSSVFTLGGHIFKSFYSYRSYDGFEFYKILDTIKLVKPVEKLVTVYE